MSRKFFIVDLPIKTWFASPMLAVFFIRPITAVIIAVASPGHRGAPLVFAREVVGRTHQVAVLLVRPVEAIHFSVTLPIPKEQHQSFSLQILHNIHFRYNQLMDRHFSVTLPIPKEQHQSFSLQILHNIHFRYNQLMDRQLTRIFRLACIPAQKIFRT